MNGYLIGVIKLVVHETGDDAGFPHRLITEEDQLVLSQGGHRRHLGVQDRSREDGEMETRSRSRSKEKKKNYRMEFDLMVLQNRKPRQ